MITKEERETAIADMRRIKQEYFSGKAFDDVTMRKAHSFDIAIEALQEEEWIPIKWHNITEEEREREGYPKYWLTILDCQMPDDDEEVLVTVRGRNGNLYVDTDTCYYDGSYYSLDSGYDWIDDVVAWMPKPVTYKESEDNHDS